MVSVSQKPQQKFIKDKRSNYDIVIAAIPAWKPTYWVPKFGVDAIQRIVECDLRQAVEIRERLEYEGAMPKSEW